MRSFSSSCASASGSTEPLLDQLWIYLKGFVSFDLGFCYRQQQPVLDSDRSTACRRRCC